MAWNFFKIACRIYSGIMAGVLLVFLLGEAVTGGIRIKGGAAHAMDPLDASTLLLWLVAIIVTAATKSEAA